MTSSFGRCECLLVALFTATLLLGHGAAAHGAKPMFVFGDSYVDAGNHNYSDIPWRYPYGITWPHHPSGRYSNGLVLTDFMASYQIDLKFESTVDYNILSRTIAKEMNGTSPTPYRFYNKHGHSLHEIVRNGVNFAVGGSGAFEAFNPSNLSVQVDSFKSVLQSFPLNLIPLQQSPVLVSINGNDYSFYLQNNNGNLKGLPDYITRVVGEIIRNIERLYGMGLRRFVVGNLLPQGCIPTTTANVFYKRCLSTYDPLVQYHNGLLAQELNATFRALKDADFFLLDQYRAFSIIIAHPSSFGIKHRLQPCCVSKPGKNGYCGNVDENGDPVYKLCSNPETHLFWDGVHPTQAGWNAITSISFVRSGNSQLNNVSPNLATWLRKRSLLPNSQLIVP